MPKSNEQSIVWFTPFIEVCAIKMSNTLPKTMAVDLDERKKRTNIEWRRKKNTWKLHRRWNNESYCNTLMISIKWTMFLLCFELFIYFPKNVCCFFLVSTLRFLRVKRFSNTNEDKDNIYMRDTGKKTIRKSVQIFRDRILEIVYDETIFKSDSFNGIGEVG